MPPRKSRASTGRATTAPTKSTPSRKRKATTPYDAGDHNTAKRPRNEDSKPKDLKQTEISTSSADKLERPITINRAPVLELWGACVAHFTHPDLSWDLCLSIGSSISTITAISKGRAIGSIAPPDESKKRKGDDDDDEEDLPTINVMGFPIITKGDAVMVKGKPKTTREANLQRKYGEGNYERAKDTMMEALESWKGDEDDLDGQAFHMYEKFRPDVATGQKGWGRKGELHLSKIKDVVRR